MLSDNIRSCMWLYFRKRLSKKEVLSSVFLYLCFASRFFIEFLKNDQEEFEASMLINIGTSAQHSFVLADAGRLSGTAKKN